MARTKLKPPWKRWRGALPRVPGLQGPGFRRPLRRRLKGKTTVSWFRINGKEIPIAVAQPVALGPGPHEQVPGAHPDPDDVQAPGAHPDPGVQAPAAPDPFLPRDAVYLQRFYDRMNLRRRNGDPWAARVFLHQGTRPRQNSSAPGRPGSWATTIDLTAHSLAPGSTSRGLRRWPSTSRGLRRWPSTSRRMRSESPLVTLGILVRLCLQKCNH